MKIPSLLFNKLKTFLLLVTLFIAQNAFAQCELVCQMVTVNPNDNIGQEECYYYCPEDPVEEIIITGQSQTNQYEWPQLDLDMLDFSDFYDFTNSESGASGSSTIEQKVHEEFCQSTRNKIPAAESRCVAVAMGDASYVVDSECNAIGWMYGFDYTIAGVNFTRDGLSSSDCRASVQFNRDAVVADCRADAAAYSYALEKQCSDVPR